MQLQPGDIIYHEWIIRENADGSYTIYRDGWHEAKEVRPRD